MSNLLLYMKTLTPMYCIVLPELNLTYSNFGSFIIVHTWLEFPPKSTIHHIFNKVAFQRNMTQKYTTKGN